MASTSKPSRNRYRVAEAKQQMVDKLGTDKVEFEAESGDVFSFPHPVFYSSALKKQLKAVDDDDAEGIFRILLGDEEFERYEAAGNDVDDLSFIMMQVQEDTEGALAGRKRPTRS